MLHRDVYWCTRETKLWLNFHFHCEKRKEMSCKRNQKEICCRLTRKSSFSLRFSLSECGIFFVEFAHLIHEIISRSTRNNTRLSRFAFSMLCIFCAKTWKKKRKHKRNEFIASSFYLHAIQWLFSSHPDWMFILRTRLYSVIFCWIKNKRREKKYQDRKTSNNTQAT